MEKLPPRVIVQDILPFIEIDINEIDEEDQLCLFGVFRSDVLRNIWFVFRSVKLQIGYSNRDWRNSFNFRVYMQSSKLFSLKLHIQWDEGDKLKKMVNTIVNESPRMWCLRNLSFFPLEARDIRCLRNLFHEPKCFPNLKSFESTLIDMEWYDSLQSKLNWSSMESLAFLEPDFRHDLFNSAISALFTKARDENILNSLKTFKFTYNYSLRSLTLPKVVSVVLGYCQNFSIISENENLKKVRLYRVGHPTIKHFVRSNPQLEELVIEGVKGDERVDWNQHVFNPENSLLPKLRHLKLSVVIFSENTIENQKFLDFGRNLEHLDLYNVEHFSLKNFELFEYPKLKTLEMSFVPFSSLQHKSDNFKMSFSRTLVKFRLTMDSFVNTIFENNEFPVLEHLIISRTDMKCVIKGDNWNPLPELRSLTTAESVELYDEFFDHHELPKLESLMFRYNSVITGKSICRNEGSMKNLRIISLDHCPRFTDELFQKKEGLRSSLQVLRLRGCAAITGENWMFLKELKQLEIKKCFNLRTDFFKKDVCFDENCDASQSEALMMKTKM